MSIENKPNWYKPESNFFGKGYFREYGPGLTHEKTLEEVAFVEKVLGLEPGMSILDCPCGHGRHSVELAKRGYHVTGQDLNPFFIQQAKIAAKKENVKVSWVEGDMREIEAVSQYHMALNLFTAFGYLESDDEDQKALDQVAKALQPGGKFFLDVMNRDRVVRQYKPKDWNELPDGSIVIVEKEFDHLTGRNVEKRVRIWKGGKREETFLSLRMYTVAELTRMMAKAGLEVIELYGDYHGNPLSFESSRFILVSQKG